MLEAAQGESSGAQLGRARLEGEVPRGVIQGAALVVADVAAEAAVRGGDVDDVEAGGAVVGLDHAAKVGEERAAEMSSLTRRAS